MHQAITEDELAERFRQGDELAFAQVYDQYHRLVYAVARRGCPSHEEAEEVVQQVFLNAWRAASRLDPGRPMAPWLATIARRAAIDRHRRRRGVEPLALEEAAEPSVPDATDDLDRAWAVRCALEALPVAHREVLMMTHYLDLDQAQIAERLQVAVGTVKSRVHRASRALRELLELSDPGPSPRLVSEALR